MRGPTARRAVRLFGFRRVRAAVPWSLDSSFAQITKPHDQVKQQATHGPRNVPLRARAVRLLGFSPEGDTRTAGVRKPPDLGAHPTPLNARRATHGVSGRRLFPHASSHSPASGSLITMVSFVGSEVCTRRNALD